MKKQRMLLRNLEKCVLMLCTILLLGGCATAEQKEAYKKIEAQAKTNAVNYISDKYDIETEVVKVVAERVGGDAIPSNDPTGFATVTLKSDEKEFAVYITGEEASDSGKDNYQKELICKELAKEAEQICGFEAEEIYYEVVTVDCQLMINSYYNGENLDEIIDEISEQVSYKIVTLGADLNSYVVEDLRDKLLICDQIYIINCDNKENFEQVKGMEIRYFVEDVDDYVPYIEDYLHINENEIKYVDLTSEMEKK